MLPQERMIDRLMCMLNCELHCQHQHFGWLCGQCLCLMCLWSFVPKNCSHFPSVFTIPRFRSTILITSQFIYFTNNIILLCILQGLVGAPACGDVMKLQIKVGDDGKIIESKFKTFGCGSAIASSSVATEWVKGKSVDEVLSIKNSDIAAHLKLPPVKLHCSMLAEDAIKAAVQDWKDKQGAEKMAA
jgi:iron-sulfur cluster assembly enzyme ISCU, mitochondrial